MHAPSPRLEFARTRSQDVLDPVALRSVGEGDDVPIVGMRGVECATTSIYITGDAIPGNGVQVREENPA